MPTYVYIICGILGLFLAIYSIADHIKSKKKDTAYDRLIKASKKKTNYLYPVYRIFRTVPVVRRYFNKIKNKYKAIYPADEITLNTEATKRMGLCMLAGLGIVILSIIISGGDLPYVIVGLVIAYIAFTHMVNVSEENLQIKLLNQLDTFINAVHDNYHTMKLLPESIEASIDELPYEISLHARAILDILNSPYPEEALQDYQDIAPNRFLLLFASILVSVEEYGNKELENGKSIFNTNVNNLIQELNNERHLLKKRSVAFAGKTIGVLAPLFVLKPFQMLLTMNMPDLNNFYEGAGGVISLSVVTLLSLICYELINIVKDNGEMEASNSQTLKKLSEIGLIKRALIRRVNQNHTKSLKQQHMLNTIGDKNGVLVFKLKRFIWAIGFFLIVNIVSLVGMARAKAIITTSFDEAFGQELVPNEQYRKDLQDISLSLNGEIREGDDIETAVKDYIKAHSYDERMTEAITKELTERRAEYHTHYYKWWMLAVSLLGAALGYMIPLWLLRYRAKSMELKKEDEVAQFRTVILILMHEDGIQLATILEWMERFAKSFKNSISECLLNLEYSQEEALEEMREKEGSYVPFRQICDALLSVDDTGLSNAFDNLEVERDYYEKDRNLKMDELLAKNTGKANTLMMLPVWGLIIMHVLVPFGIYVYNMYSGFSSILTGTF